VAPIPINSHAFDVIMAEKSNADKWEVTASPLRSMVGKNSRGEHLSLQDASQLNAIQPSTNLTLIKIDPASAKTSALKKRRRSGGV
jgi:hypothetical protein